MEYYGPEGPQGDMGFQGNIGPEDPSGLPGSSSPVFQFVGVTTTTHLGDAGYRTLTESCQQDYPPEGRMCTYEEYLNTVGFPDFISFADAWIRPSKESLSCSGWSFTGGASPTVSDTGQFRINQLCSVSRPVACCAPVQ